jgi:hypothetical protein
MYGDGSTFGGEEKNAGPDQDAVMRADDRLLDHYAFNAFANTDAVLNSEAVATASVQNQILRVKKQQGIARVHEHVSDIDTLAQIIQYMSRRKRVFVRICQICLLCFTFSTSVISGASAATSNFRTNTGAINSVNQTVTLDQFLALVTEAEQLFFTTISTLILGLVGAGIVTLMEIQGWIGDADTLSSVYNSAVSCKSQLNSVIMDIRMANDFEELSTANNSFKTREFQIYRSVKEDIEKWCANDDFAKYLPAVLKNTRDTQAKLVSFRKEIRRLRREEQTVVAAQGEKKRAHYVPVNTRRQDHSVAESEQHNDELDEWRREVTSSNI